MSFQLNTNRLILREFLPEDADGILKLNQDPDVFRFTGDKPFRDKEEVLEFIRNYDHYKKNNMGRWTMILKSTGEYLGWCGLKYLPEITEADLGYRVLPEFRNKGYAFEASVASLDLGFYKLGLKKIVGRAVKENLPSIHILKKLGMEFEKEFQEHGYLCDQYYLTDVSWEQVKRSHEKIQL